MRKAFLLACVLFLHAPLLEAQEKDPSSVRVQAGFNVGFNSSLLIISDVASSFQSIADYQNAYRIGYFGSFFLRISARNLFFQPELSLGRTQCASVIYLPSDREQTTLGTPSDLECSLFSLDLPFLVGYNVIRSGSCTMGLMMGPRLRGILDADSRLTNRERILEEYEIDESIHRLNLGLTLGLSVTIDRVYFDFRYDVGLHDINRLATAYPVSPDSGLPSVRYHRRQNVLSFSVGAIF